MVASKQVTRDAPAVSAVKQRKPKGAARLLDLSQLLLKLQALEARVVSLEAYEVRK